jgi:hypothetical protein
MLFIILTKNDEDYLNEIFEYFEDDKITLHLCLLDYNFSEDFMYEEVF